MSEYFEMMLKCPKCNEQSYKEVEIDDNLRAFNATHFKVTKDSFKCEDCKTMFTITGSGIVELEFEEIG